MRWAVVVAASLAAACGGRTKAGDPEAAKARLRAAHAAMPAPGAVPACTGRGDPSLPFATWDDLQLLVTGKGLDGDDYLLATPMLTWMDNRSVRYLLHPFHDTSLPREARHIQDAPRLLVWKADAIKPPVRDGSEFKPGEVTGRVVQFDKGGKPECAWTITATNDVEVTFRIDVPGEAVRMLQVDLQEAVDAQIRAVVMPPPK